MFLRAFSFYLWYIGPPFLVIRQQGHPQGMVNLTGSRSRREYHCVCDAALRRSIFRLFALERRKKEASVSSCTGRSTSVTPTPPTT